MGSPCISMFFPFVMGGTLTFFLRSTMVFQILLCWFLWYQQCLGGGSLNPLNPQLIPMNNTQQLWGRLNPKGKKSSPKGKPFNPKGKPFSPRGKPFNPKGKPFNPKGK